MHRHGNMSAQSEDHNKEPMSPGTECGGQGGVWENETERSEVARMAEVCRCL